MASLLTVRLSKGDSPSWGFRLQGGKDFGTPLVIQKVIVGSPAERAGLVAGDSVIKVNSTDVFNLRHKDAQDVLLRAGSAFDMTIQRGGSTWKPSVVPTGSIINPSPSINNVSPVTRTSLAAKPSENIGAIGTGHNVSAKPFLNGTANGGPKLINNQYNSPLKLYSEESIAETLSAQTEVLSTGALGVNFKKNEKNYDASKSAVLSLLKEEENSPRSPDHIDTASSGINTAPSPVAIAGLRHVTAPETKPQPPSPQLPPGQNICADCERLIVGVFVRIKDKNLHVECFKCSTCGTSLKNVGYYNINNKLYCDIHAKLAARNNPPAPNLVPITVPPGERAPANAISAALASHSYPVAAPLSPKISPNQVPSFGAKPFGSVSGPTSPSSNYNSLSRGGAPLSPVAPISAPSYSPVSTTAHCVSNIVWPPVQEEPELPSACPLFYPPPSQVVIVPRKRQTSESSVYSELEEINNANTWQYRKMDENYSSGRRSTTECAETIAETVERQRLVETIIRSRPQSPPHQQVLLQPKVDKKQIEQQVLLQPKVDEKQSEQYKVLVDESETKLEIIAKPITIDNPVPKKWESQMLQALTISVGDSSSPQPLINSPCIAISEKKPCEDKTEDTFAHIPTKKTTTALGSALAVAPTAPFTPADGINLEAVPLPEETVPYFPPEDLFVIPINDSSTSEKGKGSKKKKDPNLEKLLEDLPKPQGKLTMRAALMTAPDRPFTPAPGQTIEREESKIEESKTEESSSTRSETKTTKVVEKRVRPTAIPVSLESQTSSDITPSPECLPLFQGFTCSFQNKTEHSQFDIQIATAPPSRDKKHKKEKRTVTVTEVPNDDEVKEVIKTETTEEKTREEKSCKKKETKASEKVVYKKPEPMISLHKPQTLPPYQVSVRQNAEADLIILERKQKVKQQQEQKEQKLVELVAPIQQVECPTIKVQENNNNLHRVENSFKPVVDSRPQSCTFSPRPRALTPSMISKPPPILPSYQLNLVAQKYGPPTVNYLDAKSPVISRSPSPLPETLKPAKSSNIRPKSPAQGPPDNPLQKSYIPTREDFKLEEAKESLQTFIPQYKEKLETLSGRESRNEQRNILYTADVVAKQETAPVIKTQAESRYEEKMITSANSECQSKIMESKLKQTADSQKEELRTNISGNAECVTKSTEKSHLEQSEDFRKTEDKSVEKLAGGVQIQRKKTVIEELEHTQKSQEITIEKNVKTTNRCFANVRNPEEEKQHVVGLHVTDPNRIRSSFLKSGQDCPPPKINTVCQKIGKEIPPPVKIEEKIPPATPKFDATTLPKPKQIPEFKQPETEPKRTPPKPIKHVDPPGSSKSNQTLNPDVPPSGAGAAGGRQAGAVGIAPKRGRGVLNAAQLGGRIPLCGLCHDQIRGPFITALGKIWCPNHFTCSTPTCKRPLQDLGFVEEHGQLYCEYCYEQYLAPTCGKCNSKIKGDCLKAIGKSFHPECFNCVHCGKLFGNSPFFLEDGNPYCETDWNEFFTTKCFACGFPVEAGDRWVEALSNNYHSQCFNCTMCKKNLEGQSFFAKGGRPYCKNHAR